MINVVLSVAKTISDNGNELASKWITISGYTGGGFTLAQSAASNGTIQKAVPIAQDFASACAESPTWLIYVPAVMAATLIFKHGADFYFRRMENKKIMNEDKTNKDNIC